MSDELTVDDVLQIMMDRAQWCRENGDTDMRNILNTGRALKQKITEGKSRDEVLAYFAPDDDDE